VLATSPSDYLGLNSGETMKKTKAIMERAVGNVLVIDEVRCYVTSSYCTVRLSKANHY
jgi:hypothetical protein